MFYRDFWISSSTPNLLGIIVIITMNIIIISMTCRRRLFRLPYHVNPLNSKRSRCWKYRREEKMYILKPFFKLRSDQRKFTFSPPRHVKESSRLFFCNRAAFVWVFVAFSDLIWWDEVTMKEGKSTVAWRPLLLRLCLVSFGRCSCKKRVPVPEWWTLGSFTSLFFFKWKLNSAAQTFSRSLALHAAFVFCRSLRDSATWPTRAFDGWCWRFWSICMEVQGCRY